MRREDKKLVLSKNARDDAAAALIKYMREHLDCEAGNMSAQMLVDFITEELGNYWYNMGVGDAMKYMAERTEDLYLLMRDEN